MLHLNIFCFVLFGCYLLEAWSFLEKGSESKGVEWWGGIWRSGEEIIIGIDYMIKQSIFKLTNSVLKQNSTVNSQQILNHKTRVDYEIVLNNKKRGYRH